MQLRRMLTPLPISGYVLAGGRSSRMGADKSLLPLAGKPLIAHAVAKLRRICAEVHIVGSNPALATYGSLVPDIHPGCGPIGGIESALAHASNDWILVLPVDVPFLPVAILEGWAAEVTAPGGEARVALFTADGRPQPAVCLLHKQIAPSIASAVGLGEFKLLPVLEASAEVLALQRDQPVERILSVRPLSSYSPADQSLWFANLNTPEDFAEAEANASALDC
jgi:molybdopterin-guanine dinucleotide biosynthesis protein A